MHILANFVASQVLDIVSDMKLLNIPNIPGHFHIA